MNLITKSSTFYIIIGLVFYLIVSLMLLFSQFNRKPCVVLFYQSDVMSINKFKQEGEILTNVEQIITERTGIIEGNVEKSKHSEIVSIPVKNGYGSKDIDIPSAIVTTNHEVIGEILAPDKGTWRVVVKNTQKTVNLDESGLRKGNKRSIKYTKHLGKDTIHVEVYWENEDHSPIREDTTFVAKIDY